MAKKKTKETVNKLKEQELAKVDLSQIIQTHQKTRLLLKLMLR